MIKVIEGCGWSIVCIRGGLDKCNCRSAMRWCRVLGWRDDSYLRRRQSDFDWNKRQSQFLNNQTR